MHASCITLARDTFLINDEKTVLKALKKIFGKAPDLRASTADSVLAADNEGQHSAPAPQQATTPDTQPKPQPTERSAEKPRRQRSRKSAQPAAPAWKLDDFVVEPAEGKTRFHDFKLAPELMHAIHDLGFPYCTPIQAQVLGYTLAGRDAIGRAQTGTGKTAAFLISTITQLLDTPPPKDRYMGEPKTMTDLMNHGCVKMTSRLWVM